MKLGLKTFNKAGLQIKDQDDNKESIALINGYCETYLKWIADRYYLVSSRDLVKI